MIVAWEDDNTNSQVSTTHPEAYMHGKSQEHDWNAPL